jgi:methionyl-tRNA synthetase
VKNYLNAELADTLGNLLSRSTAKAINKNQIFPRFALNQIKIIENEAFELIGAVDCLADKCKDFYLNGNFYLGINAIMDCLRQTNLFFNNTKPWLLVKQNSEEHKLQAILFITLEVLRVCGILLQPIVPNIANQVLNKLNINSTERKWINAKQTFNYCSIKSDSIESNYLSSDKSVIFSKVSN